MVSTFMKVFLVVFLGCYKNKDNVVLGYLKLISSVEGCFVCFTLFQSFKER